MPTSFAKAFPIFSIDLLNVWRIGEELCHLLHDLRGYFLEHSVFIGLIFPGHVFICVILDLLLALSTIGVFISQVKRGRGTLSSLGWTLVLLILGLVLGAVLSGLAAQSAVPVVVEQWQALPALILLLAGALLLA